MNKSLDFLASPTGLEPATHSLGNCCSIRLSYGDCAREDIPAARFAPIDMRIENRAQQNLIRHILPIHQPCDGVAHELHTHDRDVDRNGDRRQRVGVFPAGEVYDKNAKRRRQTGDRVAEQMPPVGDERRRILPPADPFDCLADGLERYRAATIPGLPPFQGGAAGLFAYDLCHYLERLPRSRYYDVAVPDMAVGLYDWVISFDHEQERAWLISTGFPVR